MKYGIPLNVADAALMLVSNKLEDLELGRRGMGTVLFVFIDYIVQQLPPDSKISKLSDKDLELC